MIDKQWLLRLYETFYVWQMWLKKKINQVSLPLQGKQMTVSVANDEVGFWLWYVSVISEFF